MTTIRYLEAPSRRPGESGRAFVERMLAELSRKGGATAPPPKVDPHDYGPTIGIGPMSRPTNPHPDSPVGRAKVEITAKTVRVDKALEAKPKIELEPLPPCKSPQAYTPGLTPYCVWLEQRFKWHGPPCEPFGPVYPALPGANKWRRMARGRELTLDEKREYGQTVLDAINAMNAKLLDREVAPFRSNSASGTFHNNGKDILAAINAQNRAAATR